MEHIKLGLKEKLNSVLAMATNDSNYEVRKTAVVSLKNQRSKFPTTVYQKTIFTFTTVSTCKEATKSRTTGVALSLPMANAALDRT